MKVHMVEAEHFSVPGRIIKLFFNRSDAVREAVELVNIQLKDAGRKNPARESNWEKRMHPLQDEYGAAHCYVELTEIEVEGVPPE